MGNDSKKKNMDELLGAGKYMLFIGVPLSIVVIIFNEMLFPDMKFLIYSEVVNNTIGTILLVVGLIRYMRTMRVLRIIYTKNMLYTEGPFKRIRHPLYSAILLFILPGTFILLRDYATIAAEAILLIIFYLTIGKEEKLLLDKFGDDYRRYMERTGRLVPKIFGK